jgi:RimJ/RimL family protein N-acetyltransferase
MLSDDYTPEPRPANNGPKWPHGASIQDLDAASLPALDHHRLGVPGGCGERPSDQPIHEHGRDGGVHFVYQEGHGYRGRSNARVDTGVIASRVYDAGVVKSILLRPDILATIAEDGADDFEIDIDRDIWLLMKSGDTEVGIYQIERLNSITAQIHANVLPEHRKPHSKATGRAALAWVHENLPQIHKIIAVIPSLYPNVRDFTLSFGFKLEGTNRESYLKNGAIHDQWILGITRPEIGNA